MCAMSQESFIEKNVEQLSPSLIDIVQNLIIQLGNNTKSVIEQRNRCTTLQIELEEIIYGSEKKVCYFF